MRIQIAILAAALIGCAPDWADPRALPISEVTWNAGQWPLKGIDRGEIRCGVRGVGDLWFVAADQWWAVNATAARFSHVPEQLGGTYAGALQDAVRQNIVRRNANGTLLWAKLLVAAGDFCA